MDHTPSAKGLQVRRRDDENSQSNGPFLVVLSHKTEQRELAYECRRKGFLVGALVKTKDGNACLLSFSPKLVVKLSIELNLPMKSYHEYSNLEKLRLASAAIAVVERAGGIDVEDVWVSHDKNMLKDIDSTTGDAHLEHIKDYYGSKIAMYFGWLGFFTRVLAIPSIAGVLLFCHQMYLQDVDSIWVPFFCVLIALWSTYFLEFWKRRGSELSFLWKVFGVEDADAEQDLAKVYYGLTKHVSRQECFFLLGTFCCCFSYEFDRLRRSRTTAWLCGRC
jgi:hypothetical protein